MSNDSRDRQLGVNRKITRRDFLNGVKVAVGGAILASNPSWLHGSEVADLTSPLAGS